MISHTEAEKGGSLVSVGAHGHSRRYLLSRGVRDAAVAHQRRGMTISEIAKLMGHERAVIEQALYYDLVRP